MAQVSSKYLQKLILDVAKKFDLRAAIREVDIESSPANEPEGALRIVLRVTDLEKADVIVLAKFIDALEDSLSEKDDRFPSVRFAEAA